MFSDLFKSWVELLWLRGHKSSASQYPYIFVDADGNARELHIEEQEYLEPEFHGADGGRPYIKIPVPAAEWMGRAQGLSQGVQTARKNPHRCRPEDNPIKPTTRQQYLQFLRDKGCDIVENPDGSFTEIPSKVIVKQL